MFWVNVRVKIAIATRFIWIPGMRPVIVPAMMPKKRGMIGDSIKRNMGRSS